MYVRVAWFEGDPNVVTPGLKENLLPALEDIDGYQGGYWALADTNKGVGITFFESQSALEGSRETADGLREKMAERLGNAPAEFEEYEVFQTTGEKVHRDAGVMRVIRVEGDSKRIAESAEQIQSRAIPELQKFDGFLGAAWMTDRSTGRGLTFLLWDNQQNLDKATGQLDELRERMMASVGARTISVANHSIILRAEAPAAARR
jgi:hypothetical protein